jgi:hypothetical protein
MNNAPSIAGPLVLGIPLLLLLFGAVLVGVVFLHKRTLEVALVGLVVILGVRLGLSRFDLVAHVRHEWAKLLNLLGLLVGFALLADIFEASRLPQLLPRVLPRGARGCFVLLALVWLLSGLLDNIAAAIIGATVAAGMFERRVHLSYLAAVVAAANAGGAGSALGDTTTTMMWIDGVSPLDVLPAYLGSATALVVFGTFASLRQAKYAPMARSFWGLSPRSSTTSHSPSWHSIRRVRFSAACLRGRPWRVDGLVRILRGRRRVRSLSGGKVGLEVASPRLACTGGLHSRLFRPVRNAWLASLSASIHKRPSPARQDSGQDLTCLEISKRMDLSRREDDSPCEHEYDRGAYSRRQIWMARL